MGIIPKRRQADVLNVPKLEPVAPCLSASLFIPVIEFWPGAECATRRDDGFKRGLFGQTATTSFQCWHLAVVLVLSSPNQPVRRIPVISTFVGASRLWPSGPCAGATISLRGGVQSQAVAELKLLLCTGLRTQYFW